MRIEGAPEGFFETRAAAGRPAGGDIPEVEAPDKVHVDACNRTEDIAIVENEGFNVDDDNRLTKEKIPTAAAPSADKNCLFPG